MVQIKKNKELFEKNLQNPQRKFWLKKHGWLDKKITYNLNNYGFRTSEFAETENFIALGCSFTFGVGLPEEEIWTSLLSNQLNLPNWNLGVPGSSSDTSYRLAKYFIPMLRPKFVVMLEPPSNRFEVCYGKSPNIFTGTQDYEKDDRYFLKTWFFYDENSYLRAEKNKQAIAYLCNRYNTDFYCYDSNSLTQYNDKSFARDLQHPGTEAHEKFVNQVYQDIINKRTYDT